MDMRKMPDLLFLPYLITNTISYVGEVPEIQART